jgi:hypothetical protein
MRRTRLAEMPAPAQDCRSLDVEGLDLGWRRDEIVASVREGRER